jgi:hypothetical protein
MDDLAYFHQVDAATLIHGALFMLLGRRHCPHRLLGRRAALRLTPARDWAPYLSEGPRRSLLTAGLLG